jgi:hypothetical protein
MTISENIFQKPQNSYIAVSSEAMIGQAIAALLAANGQQWWKLIVRSQDGSWLGTTFGDLYYAVHEMPDAANIRVTDCAELELVPTLEWEVADLQKAEYLASHNHSTIVAIVKGSDLVGIIVAPRRDAVTPLNIGKLKELTGQYVDLKQYSAILLSTPQNKNSEPQKKIN